MKELYKASYNNTARYINYDKDNYLETISYIGQSGHRCKSADSSQKLFMLILHFVEGVWFVEE